MFTGLIRHRATVTHAAQTPTGLRLTLSFPLGFGPIEHGDSIAINGTCLTATGDALPSGDCQTASFDAIPETLTLTTLGALSPGAVVHVEASARIGDAVHGHIVQGHVDGVATVRQVDRADGWRVTLDVPPKLAPYLAPKGSVALDGVSLTVAAIEGNHLTVALIPTTLAETDMGRWSVGTRVNIECDPMAKQIVRYLTHFASTSK